MEALLTREKPSRLAVIPALALIQFQLPMVDLHAC
jgi:hypothetical protein